MTETQKTAVITGASRGIGAATAICFAEHGFDVVITYRNKASRANAVADQIRTLGRSCLVQPVDLTDRGNLSALIESIRDHFGSVDALVLNAAGGLEKDKDQSYAYRLNVEASQILVDECLPLMPRGSAILYITSHMAHFYNERNVLQGYEAVASTKRLAEDALRAKIPDLSAKGIKLVVVSGDLIQGTVNSKLLDRKYPNLLKERLKDVGRIPTVVDFGTEVVNAAQDPSLVSGSTVFIGSTDWRTYDGLFFSETAGLTESPE